MSISAAANVIEAQDEVATALAAALANTTIATLKAQNYHWNVTGMAFGPLHELFQAIYEDHFEAQDTLAERAKALGYHVDGRYSTFLAGSEISECDGSVSTEQMVRKLVKDQDVLSSSLLSLARIAEEHDDAVTNDLAIGRAAVHDKFAWMLRSHLA